MLLGTCPLSFGVIDVLDLGCTGGAQCAVIGLQQRELEVSTANCPEWLENRGHRLQSETTVQLPGDGSRFVWALHMSVMPSYLSPVQTVHYSSRIDRVGRQLFAVV